MQIFKKVEKERDYSLFLVSKLDAQFLNVTIRQSQGHEITM